MSDFWIFWSSYWWLIFPLMGFVFGGFGMWTHHRAQQRYLDILKTYADQGKTPPPEVLSALQGGGQAPGPGVPPPPQPAYGSGYGWGGPWAWRGYRYGPYWAWRRAIIFGCLTLGFGIASWYDGGSHAFVVVAIIMGCLTAGSVLFALLNTVFARHDPSQGR